MKSVTAYSDTSFVGAFLGFFGIGNKTSSCVFDPIQIAAGLLILGVVIYIYGDRQNKAELREYGKWIVIIGAVLFVVAAFILPVYTSSIFGSLGMGNALLAMIIVLVGLYYLIKQVVPHTGG
jgi:hypothetical protein